MEKVNDLPPKDHKYEEPSLSEYDIQGLLIKEVCSHSCIWDLSNAAHKDQYKRAEAWRRISSVLERSEFDLQKMFAKLRDNYRRCVRKRERLLRSGSGSNRLPICNYFEELNFLYDAISDKTTEISMVYSPPSSTEIVASSSWPHHGDPRHASPHHASPHHASPCHSSPRHESPRHVSPHHTSPHHASNHESTINSSIATKKRKACHHSTNFDDLQNEYLENDWRKTKTYQEQDSDALFCMSLVQHFKDIKHKKDKKEARIKILQVFLEYDDASDCE